MLDRKLALSALTESVNVHRVDISTLVNICRTQLQQIRQMERESAQRAILVGLTLWRIRLTLPHGEWVPWQEEHLQVGRTQINYYMRLAIVFITKSRTTKVELQALPTDDVRIDAQGAMSQAFIAKLEKFVGECSLNELLVKHGIKGVTRDTDDQGEAAKAAGDDSGQMYFSEAAEALQSIRDRILKPEQLMRLQPKQLDAINVEMESSIARWRKLYAEAKGHRG